MVVLGGASVSCERGTHVGGPQEAQPAATRWIPKISLPQNYGGYVSKFAPHKALHLIAGGKLTFDEWVVLHRVAP